MSKEGKPTLQALASVLSTHHKNTDMSDIHLLVKRRLAALHLGEKLMLSTDADADADALHLGEKLQSLNLFQAGKAPGKERRSARVF